MKYIPALKRNFDIFLAPINVNFQQHYVMFVCSETFHRSYQLAESKS